MMPKRESTDPMRRSNFIVRSVIDIDPLSIAPACRQAGSPQWKGRFSIISQHSSPLYRLLEGHMVCKLNISTHGKTMCKARDFGDKARKCLTKIGGRCFTLDIRIGRNDHFIDSATSTPTNEFSNA